MGSHSNNEHISGIDVTTMQSRKTEDVSTQSLVTSQTNLSLPLFQKLDSSIGQVELFSQTENVSEVKEAEQNLSQNYLQSVKFHIVPLVSNQLSCQAAENTQLTAQPETVTANQRAIFKVSRESLKSRAHRIMPLPSTISSLPQKRPLTRDAELLPPVKRTNMKKMEWINVTECLQSAKFRVVPLIPKPQTSAGNAESSRTLASKNMKKKKKKVYSKANSVGIQTQQHENLTTLRESLSAISTDVVPPPDASSSISSRDNFTFNPEGSCAIKINNLVVSANMMCRLNFKDICSQIPRATLANNYFQRVDLRLKRNGNLLQLFSNGKIICSGAKTIDEAKKSVLILVKKLKKLKYPARFSKFELIMMATSANIKFKLELKEVYAKLIKIYGSKEIDYTPERFGALYYRLIDTKPKITFSIYSSGTILITGVKDKKVARDELEKIYPILVECKKA